MVNANIRCVEIVEWRTPKRRSTLCGRPGDCSFELIDCSTSTVVHIFLFCAQHHRLPAERLDPRWRQVVYVFERVGERSAEDAALQ